MISRINSMKQLLIKVDLQREEDVERFFTIIKDMEFCTDIDTRIRPASHPLATLTFLVTEEQFVFLKLAMPDSDFRYIPLE